MRRLGLAMGLMMLAGCGPRPEATVLQAEARWMTAMRTRDAAVLDALMAPGFTLAGLAAADRPPVPRAVWIDNALHHLRLSEVTVEDARAEVRDGTATVRATLTWVGAYDGETFRERVPVVDVWRAQEGQWRVVSRRVGEPINR